MLTCRLHSEHGAVVSSSVQIYTDVDHIYALIKTQVVFLVMPAFRGGHKPTCFVASRQPKVVSVHSQPAPRSVALCPFCLLACLQQVDVFFVHRDLPESGTYS